MNVPNVFTPNGDGINDYFVINKPFNTTIQLEVFNRWGNLVYKLSDYQNTWDGRGNQPGNILGDDLTDGTYQYVVNALNNIDGSARRFVGYITLKRQMKKESQIILNSKEICYEVFFNE